MGQARQHNAELKHELSQVVKCNSAAGSYYISTRHRENLLIDLEREGSAV
jgi:hypothetical protein